MPISSTAQISPKAEIASDAEIGPFCVVHGWTRIGAGVRIGPFCEIGVPAPSTSTQPLWIGQGALIRSHSVLYQGATLGDDLETGHRVTIRERTKVGRGVRIGTDCDIQGDCEIGDWARLHSGVFVAKLSQIHDFAWLLPHVVLTNDPTPPSDEHAGCIVGRFAVISAAATILPGVVIGERALVGAHACVTTDVPPDMVALGVPARVVGLASSVRRRDASGSAAYPWTASFHRGYPQHIVDQWLSQSENRDGT